MKNELDVLVVGGFAITDKADGGNTARDEIRMSFKHGPVSLDLIKHFVEAGGDLELAEKRLLSDPLLRQFPRQLNTIYLYDYLTRQGFETAAVSYFAFERAKFNSLMAMKPRVLALSTTFISDPSEATQIARAAKEISPQTVVIAGGIKVLKSFRQLQLSQQGYFEGLDPQELAANAFFCNPHADAGIDAFVIEESGEQTLSEIIRGLKAGGEYRHLPNLAYWKQGELVFTRRQKEPNNMESHVIDWENIPADLVGNEIPIRAGIGCPFKCSFCDFVNLHEKSCVRPIESVMAELKRIQSVFPGKPMVFTDDNLLISRQRTRQFCRAIIDSGLKFSWRGFFRADAVNEEIAGLLAASGCVQALVGAESGDEQILSNMNKKIRPKQILSCVENLTAHGISTLSTFVIGFPGESCRSIDNTISLLNSYPKASDTLLQYYPFVFFLLPLAPASHPMVRKQYRLKGLWSNWSHSTMNRGEAEKEMIRLCQSVHVPLLQYPEQQTNGIERKIAIRLMRERQQLVRKGTTVLDNTNAPVVYRCFKPILRPEKRDSHQEEYRATA